VVVVKFLIIDTRLQIDDYNTTPASNRSCRKINPVCKLTLVTAGQNVQRN